VRWLLDHAAAGAQLTQTGNLARAIVAEGCLRFDWLTLTDNPRSESTSSSCGPCASWPSR
jgi:hypothetical protein